MTLSRAGTNAMGVFERSHGSRDAEFAEYFRSNRVFVENACVHLN